MVRQGKLTLHKTRLKEKNRGPFMSLLKENFERKNITFWKLKKVIASLVNRNQEESTKYRLGTSCRYNVTRAIKKYGNVNK